MRQTFACLLLLLALPAMAGARQLTDFDALMDALKAGETVRVVADYGRCELIADNEPVDAPEAVGGMAIDAWEFFAKGAVRNDRAFVVFSHASLIEHPRQGMVQNHVKFKVYEDGKVVISARYLDPATFEETMFEKFFTTVADGDQGACSFRTTD